MTDTFEFIQKLEKSSAIFEPSYYQKFQTEYEPDGDYDFEPLNKIIKNEYIDLMKTTFKKTIDGIAGITGDKKCSSEYSNKMLMIPIFWQEIILLIYMALCLYRNVTDNSRIIALGESSLKLVFIQQVLNTTPGLDIIFKNNNMATSVDYTYFPISGLSFYAGDISWLDPPGNIFEVNKDYEFVLDNFMKEHIVYVKQTLQKIKTQILLYFELFKLDPRSIIQSNKKIYFEDRMEGYKTLIALICFYDIMCAEQNFRDNERKQLYELIYFIGFDEKLMNNAEDIKYDSIIIDRINKFLYKIITNQDPAEGFKPHFIQKNFNPPKEEKKEVEYCEKKDFNIFNNQYNIISKMFVFLTVPEKTYNNSRCAKSCKINSVCQTDIKNKFDETAEFHLKETNGNQGDNCNIINLFIMFIINELGNEYISKIIENLDNINDDIFINSIDFTEIHTQITDLVNEQKLEYNTNIIYNIKQAQVIANKVYNKIEEFILKNGLFSECKYELPLKIRQVRNRINGSRRSNSSSSISNSRRSNSSSSISNSSRRSNSSSRRSNSSSSISNRSRRSNSSSSISNRSRRSNSSTSIGNSRSRRTAH